MNSTRKIQKQAINAAVAEVTNEIFSDIDAGKIPRHWHYGYMQWHFKEKLLEYCKEHIDGPFKYPRQRAIYYAARLKNKF